MSSPGGDAGIERSLGAMYRGEGAEQVLESKGMDIAPSVFEFMGRARTALGESD